MYKFIFNLCFEYLILILRNNFYLIFAVASIRIAGVGLGNTSRPTARSAFASTSAVVSIPSPVS